MLQTYSDGDGSAFTALLHRDGVRVTEVGAPVATANRNDAQLRDDDCCANGRSDFLGGFDAESNVSLTVSDDNNSLESRALTSTGLLLYRLDLFANSISIVADHRCGTATQRTFITSSLSLGKKKSTI